VLIFVPALLASPDGKTGSAASGCTCHGNASTTVQVALDADSLAVELDEPVTLTVTVALEAGVTAGLDIAAAGGAFVAGADTVVRHGEVTHPAPALMAAGAYQTVFTWSAGADGDYRIYGAAMAADDRGNEQGDRWAHVEALTIKVGEGGPLPDTGDTGDTAADTADTGGDGPPCGCSAAGGGAGMGVAGLGLLAWRARRDRPAARGAAVRAPGRRVDGRG